MVLLAAVLTPWEVGVQGGGYRSNPGGRDGGLDQDCGCGDGEKCSDSGETLKVHAGTATNRLLLPGPPEADLFASRRRLTQ
ncbi:hypothetical protein PRBEI_2000607400 [Prionailurus iriomotensis]